MKKKNDKMVLSIVIPSYNEKKRLPRTLDAYFSFFDKKRINYEIIVADFSSDGSKEMIKKYQKRRKNLVLVDITQRGKGLAVLEGFKVAQGKYISFTDADNAIGPDDFYKLYTYLDRYDAVIGSRGMSRSHVVHYHQSAIRRLGSVVLELFFVNMMFGLRIRDTQCGAKIFKREKIMKVVPKMRIMNSIFDVELLWRFKKAGGTIKEVPIRWVDDKFSHFRWWEIIEESISLIRLRFAYK